MNDFDSVAIDVIEQLGKLSDKYKGDRTKLAILLNIIVNLNILLSNEDEYKDTIEYLKEREKRKR